MILEWLVGRTISIAAAGLTIMTAPYGSSLRMLEKRHEDILDGKFFMEGSKIKDKKKAFNSLLKKLRSDGLIETKEGKIAITKRGRLALKIIKQKFFPKNHYQVKKDDSFKLVIFDIPEKEKAKRNWLRDSLKEMGFEMIQKSVWSGKIKIPAEFLEDLNWLRLINYVDILAVTKTGSLRQINRLKIE